MSARGLPARSGKPHRRSFLQEMGRRDGWGDGTDQLALPRVPAACHPLRPVPEAELVPAWLVCKGPGVCCLEVASPHVRPAPECPGHRYFYPHPQPTFNKIPCRAAACLCLPLVPVGMSGRGTRKACRVPPHPPHAETHWEGCPGAQAWRDRLQPPMALLGLVLPADRL